MAEPSVLGNHSPRLASLRDLRTKTGRRTQQRFAIEGRTMIAEAIRSGVSIETIYATQSGLAELGDLAARSGADVYIASDQALARASDVETPTGAIAVLPLEISELDYVLHDGAPVLLLAGVGDPGNVGTLLRSAEIFGVRSAVFVQGSVEPHNPKVVRASMGAIFRVRVAVSESSTLVQAAASHRYAIVAATREGTPLAEFRWPERALIAVGNERHGVAAALPSWDFGVSIPQHGDGESLNAAVAGSIVLYSFSLRTKSIAKEA